MDAVVVDAGEDATRISLAGEAAPDTPSVFAPLPEFADDAAAWTGSVTTLLVRMLDTCGINPAGRPIIVTERIRDFARKDVRQDLRSGTPKELRESWVRLCFDRLGASSCYLALAPPLALYSSELTTGVVVSRTHVVPIYEGYVLPHAVVELDEASTADVGAVAAAVHQSIFRCDCDIWLDLFPRVVLAGALCGGDESVAEQEALAESLTVAIKAVEEGSAKAHQKASVKLARHGAAAAWGGAVVLGSFEPGTSQWIKKSEYEDGGASIVHQKCCQ
jgi:actin-related protein